MIKQAWILGALRQRSAWLAVLIPLAFVLLLGVAWSQRDWRQRATTLERENTRLQLTQLAHELTAEWEQLSDRARDLAESESILHLVQDNADASADRLEAADMSRRGVDALLVLTASHAVRFSIVIANGQLSERSPDPDLMHFVDSNAAANQVTIFTGDRWIIVRPIVARASAAPILGWVVVSRTLASNMLSQLASSVGATLTEAAPWGVRPCAVAIPAAI